MLLADQPHMTRKRRNEDPAYLQAMREAKELFDAEMARSAMKRKGRPPKAKVAVALDDEDDLDHVIEEPAPPPAPAKKKKR